MAISRAQKEQDVEQLRTEFAEIPHAILVDFKGLDVAGATDLRRRLRANEAQFKVVKNSVVLRAIEGLPLAELNELLVGQTAIAYTHGDVVSLAKTLSEFAEEFETPTFKGGVVDGVPISAEEFEQLAKLPPREELIGKLLYLMNYPITGLVTTLGGILRGVVTVLEQIREQKEEAGETAVDVAEETPAEDATEEAAVEAAAEETPAEDAVEEAADEAAAEETPAEDAAEEAAGEAAAEEAPAEDAAEEPPADAASEEEE